MARAKRIRLILAFSIGFSLLALFQNCSKDYKIVTTPPDTASSGVVIQENVGSVVVTASRSNPPLDLFFVIDNSASMLGHQINLGQAFSSVFQSNTANLSNFDVNIYVFSTASTVNASYISKIPTALLSTITSVPVPTDSTDLALIPGSIYGMQNSSAGQYGVAPFSDQFNPASVLDLDPTGTVVTPALHLAAQGAQSASAYQTNLQAVTAQFQHRLQYLNPTDQLNYESLTDISSGLCSVARVLRHSSNFIKAGDSAAFVIVSDDNDRLNVRNPSGNTCMESITSSAEVVDGTCGHYASTISYDSDATITYQANTKFTYQSGTTIPYSYTDTDTCPFTYSNGYKYTSTYTALQTSVTYTKCTLSGDGTCITQASATQTISGDYVGSGGACSQNMSALVQTPVVGSTFQCQTNNLVNQTGPSGVDANSNGTQCSSQVLGQLASSTKTNIACNIQGLNMTSGSASVASASACSSYCSTHTQYPNCTAGAVTTITTKGSLAFATVAGVTCNSTCPSASTCGTGTIAQYLTATYGSTAVCGSPAATLSTITVNAAAPALTCASNLSGLTVTNSAGASVCTGAATVQACISSLQTGTATVACAVSGGTHATVTVPTAVTCTTTCANSGGYCNPATYTTVANYLATTKSGLCLSSANAGPKSFPLTFTSTIAPTATCSSLCADVTSSSSGSPGCDGNGWGATNGSTVADYVQTQLGGASTCSASTKYVVDVASISVPSPASTAAGVECAAYPNSPFFAATDSPHAGGVISTHTSGATDLAADLQSYIVSQATSVFGANNHPALAVITQLPGDNLPGTDVGQDYINLAHAMNGAGAQISDILGNYSASLSSISNYIVTSAQNNFVLAIAPGSVVDVVTLTPSGSSTATPLTSMQWSWTGGTLSISASVNLQIGDQLTYSYH